MLLAVNFHYIQPEGRYPYPGIYPTPVDQLEDQLIELGKNFDLINGEDLIRALIEGGGLPERACLITFDDGLQEQFLGAAPVLERHGVSGVFFICTQPFAEGVALNVHKMHRLRATRSPEQFLVEALEIAETIGLSLNLDQVDDEAATKQYLYDDMATKRIKYLLNHVIPFDDFERLIDTMFSREFDEGEFCREMYMNEKQIRALSQKHMIGSHSHYHCPLEILEDQALGENLLRSRTILETVTGGEVRIISYPYGGVTAVSESVARVARDTGFVAGFTMERSVNRSLIHPQLLARVSTNDAPGGKSPLLSIDEDGRDFTFHPPMTEYRTVFFNEGVLVERGGI
jgi:peptidoglycan/xylan/chitin deacetylase (PgdA/CDA1 family)